LLGVKDHALYNASKMAVIGFIKAFATDFGKRGITVNGVAPGGIKSDMFTQNACKSTPTPKNYPETQKLTNQGTTSRGVHQNGQLRRLRR
jgi:3-oxoacyl-[acyl-carrier protein] reductase